ncbi:hatching enzyme 1.2-like [Halyomorpha halys]|uniref:hatching enzyme 1.2-like n=1 Tax=Halyomorpha halys TaxID=286706 RepID=UPI0006D51ADB|nr:zinc metalloproteinase nas-14-like [Halyomorpha halys]
MEEGEFSRIQAAALIRNLRILESVTCIKFLPKPPSQEAYIKFRNVRHRCAASIGYKPNKVLDLYIGWPECQKTGIMQHEILHGLGMWHEHTRQDRNRFITVFWENIARGKEFNFKLSPEDKTLSLPYDYGSVMHYRAQAFSKTGNEITLLPRDRSAVHVMGQRKGISMVDIAKLNRLYNCPAPYYRGDDLNGVSYVSKVTSRHQLQALFYRLQDNNADKNNSEKEMTKLLTKSTTELPNDLTISQTKSYDSSTDTEFTTDYKQLSNRYV